MSHHRLGWVTDGAMTAQIQSKKMSKTFTIAASALTVMVLAISAIVVSVVFHKTVSEEIIVIHIPERS
jgi:hypothetical protein